MSKSELTQLRIQILDRAIAASPVGSETDVIRVAKEMEGYVLSEQKVSEE